MLSSLKSKSVLIIDDDEGCLDNLAYLLQSIFMTITKADSGTSALKEYKKSKPDFIIADIETPKMNGLEFIEIIRKDDLSTSIAVLSAYPHKDYLLRLASLHLEAFVQKPLTPGKLTSLLERFCKALSLKSPSVQNICHNTLYSFETKSVHLGASKIALTNMEINLLELLLKNHDKIVTYEQIELELYSDKGMNKNMPKMFVRNLRKKIPNIPLKAKANVGYILEY